MLIIVLGKNVLSRTDCRSWANVAELRQRRHFAAFALSTSGLNHEDFYSPFFGTTEAATVPVRLERNRKPTGGEPQTPIAATPTVYDHLPTAWLPVPCKWALQGADAVPGDLKAPG